MANLRSVIQCGDLSEVYEIVRRLQSLPEYGEGYADQVYAKAVEEVEQLEARLTTLRGLVRDHAVRILNKAEAHWSSDEIDEATGYKQ